MTWRLLLDDARSGAHNMAVDEAVLLSHAAGHASPTLRFYDWSPACISLGRFQAFPDLPPSNFDIVRRPTGGRAVLHADEITYCAVLREELLPDGARSVVGAYRWLSEGFIKGLETLGVNAKMARGETPGEGDVNCFAASARCDLTVDGRKLIGAAQCRKRGAVLQHGSILLSYDADAWGVLGHAPSVVALRDLGVAQTREEIVRVLCAGFEQRLDVKLLEAELSKEEREAAHSLHEEKYARPFWTREGKESREESTHSGSGRDARHTV